MDARTQDFLPFEAAGNLSIIHAELIGPTGRIDALAMLEELATEVWFVWPIGFYEDGKAGVFTRKAAAAQPIANPVTGLEEASQALADWAIRAYEAGKRN